jgi:hypothetical protein
MLPLRNRKSSSGVFVMPGAAQRLCYVLAFLFCALALGPALAHLLALPNKIGMDEAQYFTAQRIYDGWALLGIVVAGALLTSLGLTIALRREAVPMRWALLAFLCVAAAQAVFWIFTFPANQATANWTQAPPNWEALRARWEYSHAAGAVLMLAAVMSLVLSLLSSRRRDHADLAAPGRRSAVPEVDQGGGPPV